MIKYLQGVELEHNTMAIFYNAHFYNDLGQNIVITIKNKKVREQSKDNGLVNKSIQIVYFYLECKQRIAKKL